MTGNSQIPKEILLNNLKELMPEIFSEGKVDWERLKATLGEDIDLSNERYVLNWAGKSDAFRVLQAPSTRTLIPAKEESINFDETENIFIEGENLEVLKVLQKSYFGKIKMIYIDPPYNTGNDSFIYPDKFSETKEEYQKRIGEKDEEGYMTKEGMYRKNSKENGQYHSNWLNMMYPRLFLAKNLLRDDGVIFISIDDNEVENLTHLLNEIFGEENHVATISVINNMKGRNDKANVATCHEFLLIYSKKNFNSNGLPLTEEQLKEYKYTDENGKKYALRDLRKRGRPDRREDRPNMYFPIYFNPKTNKCYLEKTEENQIPIYPLRGDRSDGRWRWGKDRVKANLDFLHPKFSEKKDRWDIQHRVYLDLSVMSEIGEEEIDDDEQNFDRTSKSKSFWWGGDISTDVANREFKRIFPNINPDYPKSPYFIEKLLHMSVNEGDYVLDFFSGYGTTAHAIFNFCNENSKNIKFILVQLPEEIEETNDAFKAGFNTISQLAIERIKRILNKIKNTNQEQIDFNPDYKQDLGFKVFKLSDSNFKLWRQKGIETAEELEKQMELFTDPISQDALNDFMVYELLIKSGFDLNSEIKHENNLYVVNKNEMVLLLESVSKEIISEVINVKPQKVIALDKLFEGNDQLKTNTALQMKDADIEFKTI